MEPASLTEAEGRELLLITRRTLEEYLKSSQMPDIQVDSPGLLQSRGAFVTLKQEDRLRGCIGLLKAKQPLYKTVMEMAVAAALEDYRFPPLAREELSITTVEISVLSPMKKIRDVKEIVVGRHGLYIIKGSHRGVLLPQVATEHGWNRDTFLGYLSMKAGLGEEEWREGATLFTFTAQIFAEE